jgi:hypothetical protein
VAEANTQIPAARVPLLDAATGLMAREWYRFFVNLQTDATSADSVNFDNVRRINFDNTPSPPVVYSSGTLAWGGTDATLDLGMNYGVVQQIGLELYARVENQTGSTIPRGTVVGFAGVGTGNTLAVAPYLANGSQPSLYILGVMAHDLPDSGQQGYCTVWGAIQGIDTTAFSAGDILYPSTTVAGAYTNVKPTAPNNVIPVAAVMSVGTNGVIFVRPTIQQQQYYGVFSKTSDQSPAAINTEYLLTFDAAEISNGVSIGTPASRIQVVTSGLYQFAATIQLTSGSASAKTVWVWFKKNGVAVPDTARLVTVNINNGYTPLALVDTLSLQAGDYVELAFAADDTAVTVDNIAATAFAPAAPAVVLTVQQAQQ